MNQFKYNVMCKVETGEVIPAVKELEKEIDHHMHDFGFSEKIKIVSKISIGQLTTARELTVKEKDTALDIIRKQFAQSDLLAKFDVISLDLACCETDSPV